MARNESGAGLLEVIAAVAILSIAAVTAVTASAESVNAVRRAREADVELRTAAAFLEAVALWTRDDLDRHLGDRPQGTWRMTVGRPLPTLYTVALSDSATGRILLRTSLFRPLPQHDGH